MITMGNNESIHLASPTPTAAFASPLSNRIMFSSHQHGQLQMKAVAMPEAVSIPHFSIGTENSHPNSTRIPKPLEVKQTDGGMVLISIIPNGFAVVDNKKFEGKKIVATESFRKGSVMYTGYAAMLDLSSIGQVFEVKIYSEDRQLLSKHYNDDTHSVDDHAPGSKTSSESKRQVYGWDGFMNHSCDANTYFPLLYRTPTEMCYQAIALRDIDVGDEITCDYALFDYDCSGHPIEVCACGSTKCRGKMTGFQGLPLQGKVGLLDMVEEEIKEKFFQEEDVVVHQSYLPQGIGLVTSNKDGSHHLVATRRFEIGQPLFINSATLISMDDLTCKQFVVDVDGQYVLLDKEQHFIYRDGYAEMLGFDSFMDHSCSPSTEQEYITKHEYVVRAKKVILPGDKIICDYGFLDKTAWLNRKIWAHHHLSATVVRATAEEHSFARVSSKLIQVDLFRF